MTSQSRGSCTKCRAETSPRVAAKMEIARGYIEVSLLNIQRVAHGSRVSGVVQRGSVERPSLGNTLRISFGGADLGLS